MIKVILVDDRQEYNTLLVSENETPYAVLKHYKLNPDTKLVYLNGTQISNRKILQPFPAVKTVFMTVREKVIQL